MPLEEIGVAAGSGGAITVLLMKMLPVLFRRVNGNGKGKSNGNGKLGKVVAQHDTAIKHLSGMCVEIKEHAETARKENREDFQRIHDKLDSMK